MVLVVSVFGQTLAPPPTHTPTPCHAGPPSTQARASGAARGSTVRACAAPMGAARCTRTRTSTAATTASHSWRAPWWAPGVFVVLCVRDVLCGCSVHACGWLGAYMRVGAGVGVCVCACACFVTIHSSLTASCVAGAANKDMACVQLNSACRPQ